MATNTAQRARDFARGPIGAKVTRARARLTRDDMRAFVRAHAEIPFGAAAVAAVLRPLVWPLGVAPPVHAPLRAGLLALGGACIAIVVLCVVAWRRRPSLLAAARRLDGALGLHEVVASGFAFERDGRGEAMAGVARARAERVCEGVVVDVVLDEDARKHAPARRSWTRARLFAALAVVAGVLVGTLDTALVDRLVHPITEREGRATERLARALDAAAPPPNAPNAPKTPEEKKAAAVIEAAKRAAEAAHRGDRKNALAALDEMRAASRALDAEQRDREQALRALRDALDPARGSDAANGDPSAAGSERPSSSASEALQKMVDALAKGADAAALAAMTERLARAEAQAAARAGGEGAAKDARWERAASALREAREALARGDKAAAARALERAARELGAMEKRGGSQSERALSQVMSRASELDRSLRAGMRGEGQKGPSAGKSGKGGEGDGDGEDGDSEGEGTGKKPSAKSGSGKANGPGKGTNGAPGTGPDGPGATMDHGGGPEAQRIRVNGNLTVRGDVRAGERAVSAIQGMGKGGDPRAFREVFPSYDSAVEDGLRDELVPAARRPVVRRYFSSIRPGEAPAGTE